MPHPPRRPSACTIEGNIRRLEQELEEIDSFLYRSNEHDDRYLHQDQLEHKRDDVVRSAVLQMHTSIEDLLNVDLQVRILGKGRKQSKRARALARMLQGGSGGLNFEMKLNFAKVVGILNAPTSAKLRELNGLRNKCSHNWRLDVLVRRGKKPAAQKPPLLMFRGRDLHKVHVLKDFWKEYGSIYVRLFLRHLDFI